MIEILKKSPGKVVKKRIRTLIGAIDIAIKIKDYEALKKHLTFVRKKVKEEWGE
jgi:hypothetical protein